MKYLDEIAMAISSISIITYLHRRCKSSIPDVFPDKMSIKGAVAGLSVPPAAFLLFLFTISSTFIVSLAAGRNLAGESPFTAKASLVRYWKKHVSGNDSPTPFFLSKASPLTAVQLATYSNLAGQRSLSTKLAAFCKDADLLCFPEVGTSLESHKNDVKFSTYKFQNFTNYGTRRRGGTDTFSTYTNDETFPIDTFRSYSRSSVSHGEKFTTYAENSTVPRQSFNNYGTRAAAGGGEFSSYNNKTAVINNIEFTSYSDSSTGRTQNFKQYAADGQAIGDQHFTSYGKSGEGTKNKFANYGDKSRAITNDFKKYDEGAGKFAADNFTSYGIDNALPSNNFTSYSSAANFTTETFAAYTSGGGIPISDFTTYGSGGNNVHQDFTSYSDNSTSPHNRFKTYAADSKSESFNFTSYAAANDEPTFKQYAKNAVGQKIGFKKYNPGSNFKEYSKTGVSFATYLKQNAAAKKVAVEPGKFFRERMLKTGTVMPMPDIKDKMPKRSFLPRAIYSKLPFSSKEIGEMKEIFHAGDDSSLDGILTTALTECERAPSAGETKRCAGSGEDMIDFATSVLGKRVAVRTTENTRGSGGNIMIGEVMGINGGKVTKSVSCHQSLYPSLLYYCHSVPKVRVYEADILDPNSKEKINRGVAICHVDTSSWSSGHGAFMALGSGPGKIEVCHWIFENDMTWTISD